MEKVSREQVEQIASRKGLSPVRIMDTDLIKLVSVDMAKRNSRFVEIPWDEFWSLAQKKNLAVMYDGGYLFIRRG